MEKFVISGERKISHQEILQNAAKAARGLEEECGLSVADSVAIFMRNDFAFFEDKDYKSDFDPTNSVTTRILTVINQFRSSVKNSSIENKMKALKYGQNLNRLCEFYFDKTS